MLQLALSGRAQPAKDFSPIMNWTNGTLPHTCGVPGEPSCFIGCADAPGDQIRIDPFTRQSSCNLPDPVRTLSLGTLFVRNPYDIMFLVMTDVHLRNGTNGKITDAPIRPRIHRRRV
jgi:hypothetical protein